MNVHNEIPNSKVLFQHALCGEENARLFLLAAVGGSDRSTCACGNRRLGWELLVSFLVPAGSLGRHACAHGGAWTMLENKGFVGFAGEIVKCFDLLVCKWGK